MTLFDFLFLAPVLLILVLFARMAVSASRGRTDQVRRFARWLGYYVAAYAVVLIAVALVMPRRFRDPGVRHCFDDWCVAGVSAQAADSEADPPCQPQRGSRSWVAVIEVSSVAKRVRQRARDVRVELEDRRRKRYQPCAAPLANGAEPRHLLSDELGPGESFRVLLAFRLPGGAEPTGLVVHHGEFPGNVIIGDDQSFLHPPALLKIAVEKQQ
jgi:hypothetical protein